MTEPDVESLRRPSVLAALAAALLAVNLVVLAAGADGSQDDDADPAAAPDSETGSEEPDTDAPGEDAVEGTEGTDGTGEQADAEGGATEGATEGQPEGEGEAAEGEGEGAGDGEAAALGTPAAGTYEYATRGSWSLSGGSQPEEHQLPETAIGTVQVDGDTWQIRRTAGERYADRFGYTLGPDGGLDWTSWVLERQFGDGPRGETSYTCSGDAAYYRADEQGWTVQHDCRSEAGIVSDGQVQHLGTEEITLADGIVVTADRLVYSYTVSGSGTTADGNDFDVSGEGRLGLWLDPATGLRLREQRNISTTTSYASGDELVYDEDVEFTLQSTRPS